ncbi:Sterile alpha motif domain-containing protein 7 [Acipenser ruthenus]|uniref:Sterile alpha motif domain-containing protein 7 n=2 Tax=Acipenser ruthenus TaxID=7906 RepID=A0A444TZ88_ACIRT|nr:Sterile alpha motif domain-containing protein 7 [Acipenser ruthenus]
MPEVKQETQPKHEAFHPRDEDSHSEVTRQFLRQGTHRFPATAVISPHLGTTFLGMPPPPTSACHPIRPILLGSKQQQQEDRSFGIRGSRFHENQVACTGPTTVHNIGFPLLQGGNGTEKTIDNPENCYADKKNAPILPKKPISPCDILDPGSYPGIYCTIPGYSVPDKLGCWPGTYYPELKSPFPVCGSSTNKPNSNTDLPKTQSAEKQKTHSEKPSPPLTPSHEKHTPSYPGTGFQTQTSCTGYLEKQCPYPGMLCITPPVGYCDKQEGYPLHAETFPPYPVLHGFPYPWLPYPHFPDKITGFRTLEVPGCESLALDYSVEGYAFSLDVLYDSGEPCVRVECGENHAFLYLTRLCQGSRGLSIQYKGMWLTPNEFQSTCGRENAKDWKRSIKHKGKNLKWLMSRGLISTHPPVCDHIGCDVYQSGERDPAIEQTAGFSGLPGREGTPNTEGVDKKQEDKPCLGGNHARLHDGGVQRVKRQQDDAGLKKNPTDSLPETTEKHRRTGEVPYDMTPREHLRKMSALGEQGSLEEKHWYRLVNGMVAGELRQRQELLMRNQMTMNPQMLGPGQQRIQGMPPQFEPHFMDRDLVSSSEMVPSEARQMHMGSHLGAPLPPHSNMVQSRGFPGAGYGFVPSESMDSVARRQELIHKQNLARMEMNAILHQKELENAHQKSLMGMEAPLLYPGIPANAMTFRGRQKLPEGHLPNDMLVHRTTLDELQGNALLMSANPYPPIGTLHRERGRRAGRRASNQKSMDCNTVCPKNQSEDKNPDQTTGTLGEEKEAEVKGESENETTNKPDQAKMGVDLSSSGGKGYKDCDQGQRKNSNDTCPESTNCNTVCSGSDKDLPNPCSAFHEKYMYPTANPLSSLSYGFPLPGNGLLPPGAHSVFHNGDEMSSVEDIRKWTVEDVYSFINSIPGCSEYAQTFKDHIIDGETLPLLTEEHLLDTLGLKLGPALKIRSQVSQRLGNMFYMMNLPLSAPLQSTPEKPANQSSEVNSPVNCNSSVELLGSPCSRESEGMKPPEQPAAPENSGTAAGLQKNQNSGGREAALNKPWDC